MSIKRLLKLQECDLCLPLDATSNFSDISKGANTSLRICLLFLYFIIFAEILSMQIVTITLTGL